MKTHVEVQRELERLERLVPHIISDQGDRAEEILGFHVASLLGSASLSDQGFVREHTAQMVQRCRKAQDQAAARGLRGGPMAARPQLA